MTDKADLALLAAADELTQRRVTVDVAAVWDRLHGRAPRPDEWPAIRRAVLRLEREGLVRSDLALRLEVTADGQSVLEPRNSA
jgi:hypothetical protein